MSQLRLTRRQSREVDRIAIEEYGIPSIVLMENAARSIADAVDELCCQRELTRHGVVFCGKGNNGGDGLAAARHLVIRGYRVDVVLCDPPELFTGDAKTNFGVLSAMNIPTMSVADFDPWRFGICWVAIDAIYGTGFRPPPRTDVRMLSDSVRGQMAGTVAIDLPSGLDADTGETSDGNCFEADVTVTLAAEKTGFANFSSRRYTGQVVVADIGVPPTIIERVAASP